MQLAKPVFYSGNLKVERPPVDDEFGVTVSTHAMMHRKVEIYCYREEVTKRIERKGGKSRRVTDIRYSSVWVDAKD